jgi:6-phosphogluconolactonase/glucosamine-6-phosphate isomerase/deaminase
LQLSPTQYHLFDGQAADLQAECRKMDELIASKGGIDLMIVGIGMNGHIGFNEPGTPFHLHAHITALDPVTATVGQQYFDHPMSLKQGITLGPAYLREAGKVLLLAQGSKKASVIRDAVEGEISIERPASILQEHPDAHFYLDNAAAAELKSNRRDA